jgi:hypothetical protein
MKSSASKGLGYQSTAPFCHKYALWDAAVLPQNQPSVLRTKGRGFESFQARHYFHFQGFDNLLSSN